MAEPTYQLNVRLGQLAYARLMHMVAEEEDTIKGLITDLINKEYENEYTEEQEGGQATV